MHGRAENETMRRGILLVGVLATLAAVGAAREPGFGEFRAIHDSLLMQPPRLRSRWLNERGLKMPGWNTPLPPADFPDSGGLRLVGKFGRGPSVEVTGKNSLVFLSLGSEVAVINMADPDSPEVLSEPQAMGVVTQAAVRDSFLYIGCMTGQTGIEVWNIQDPANPVFRSRTPTLLSDFCINDTFLYLTQSNAGLSDTFKVYSIADPNNVYLLGSCRDSGDVVTYANNTAFLGDRWGFYAIDVSNPASPRRVGAYGGMPLCVEGRNSIVCVTFGNPNQPDQLQFEVLDVTNPASPRRLGLLDNTGGYDLWLADSFCYVSGYYGGAHEFKILNIADSTLPNLVGTCFTPGDGRAVWVTNPLGWAVLADYPDGLSLVDIADPSSPVYDTSLLMAGFSQDVDVEASIACVASNAVGLALVDLSDPTRPIQLGLLDSGNYMLSTYTAAVSESLAFMGFSPSLVDLRAVDISDPACPVTLGGVNAFNRPQDLVVRDSFVYSAESNKFEIVNFARPREPVLVGSCNLPGDSRGLVVEDAVAYVAQGSGGLYCVDISDPETPAVLGSWAGRTSGVHVVDTVALVAGPYTGCVALSVADPSAPYVLDSIHLTDTLWWNDVVVVETLAYVGGERLWAVNVSDPQNLRLVSGVSWVPPYLVRRLVYVAPYFYAACYDAGVAILETTQVGIAEGGGQRGPGPCPGFRAGPNPTGGLVRLAELDDGQVTVQVFDVAGKEVMNMKLHSSGGTPKVDLSTLPSGLYFLDIRSGSKGYVGKVIKR